MFENIEVPVFTDQKQSPCSDGAIDKFVVIGVDGNQIPVIITGDHLYIGQVEQSICDSLCKHGGGMSGNYLLVFQ